MSNQQKEQYMKRAIELAKNGAGFTSPNPMVGCVVVRDNEIIAEGYHEKCGGFHAERNALLSCEDAKGADLYVTLEPCCHYGKTPPCTEIIIEKGIKRVFVGSVDSNPLVGGKGISILRDAGIEVETGILEDECRSLNEVFFYNMEKKRPFLAMKYAMSLDGKIACKTGDSKWITSEEARGYVQNLRHLYAGILVGIQTVLEDDPMLNCRMEGKKNPVRIICDSKLRIPLESQIVKTAKEIKTIVYYCNDVVEDESKIAKLEERGVEVIATSGIQVNWDEVMDSLYEKKIDGVLVEGGGTINESLLKAGLISRVYAFVAPKLIGGKDAKTPIEGNGIDFMSQAQVLEDIEIVQIGPDVLITGKIERDS